jgi:hypothetical protein
MTTDLERRLAAEIANREKCCRDGNTISDELFDVQLKLKASKAEVEGLKAQLSRAVTIGEALSSELVFPDFVNELNSLKASLSSPSSP